MRGVLQLNLRKICVLVTAATIGLGFAPTSSKAQVMNDRDWSDCKTVGRGYSEMSNWVRAVQYQVYAAGFNGVGAVDGIYGPNTEKAIKAYQTKYGLKSDGIVGKGTWTHMDNYLKAGSGGYTYVVDYGKGYKFNYIKYSYGMELNGPGGNIFMVNDTLQMK
ncbi:hypothetical protein CN946_08325 [Bacillus sp. AFS053548]|nr:hypothetical protein CN946_08325 [Bacillus sp. AFS053548]